MTDDYIDITIFVTLIIGMFGFVGLTVYDITGSSWYSSDIKLSELSKRIEEIERRIDDDSTEMNEEVPESCRYFSYDGFNAYYITESNGDFILVTPNVMIRGTEIKNVHRVMTTRSTCDVTNVVIDYINASDKECHEKLSFYYEDTSEEFMNWINV